MMAGCEICGEPTLPDTRTTSGRPRRFCSERCRKRQYDLQCVVCSGRVDGTTPGKLGPEPVCKDCAGAFYKIWTQEAIVAAIQEWADQHGGIPPKAKEWNHGLASTPHANDRAWPTVTVAQREFGSWNAAIAAAGFDPRPVGTYGRLGEDPAEIQRCVNLYGHGYSLSQVGRIVGCTPATVAYRLEKAGVKRRPKGRHANAVRLDVAA